MKGIVMAKKENNILEKGFGNLQHKGCAVRQCGIQNRFATMYVIGAHHKKANMTEILRTICYTILTVTHIRVTYIQEKYVNCNVQDKK